MPRATQLHDGWPDGLDILSSDSSIASRGSIGAPRYLDIVGVNFYSWIASSATTRRIGASGPWDYDIQPDGTIWRVLNHVYAAEVARSQLRLARVLTRPRGCAAQLVLLYGGITPEHSTTLDACGLRSAGPVAVEQNVRPSSCIADLRRVGAP